jgi:hypothetical protein
LQSALRVIGEGRITPEDFVLLVHRAIRDADGIRTVALASRVSTRGDHQGDRFTFKTWRKWEFRDGLCQKYRDPA